jgi:hypothetical protein
VRARAEAEGSSAAAAADAAERRAALERRGEQPDELLRMRTQHEYLKSVVSQYLASPPIAAEADARHGMETAIATVLALSPQELAELQKKRDAAVAAASSWW